MQASNRQSGYGPLLITHALHRLFLWLIHQPLYDVSTFREEKLSLSLSLSSFKGCYSGGKNTSKSFITEMAKHYSLHGQACNRHLDYDHPLVFTHAIIHLFLLSIHQPNCDDATFKVEKESIKTKLYLNNESWQAGFILRKDRVRS